MEKEINIADIDLLIGKYLSNNASAGEISEFLHWLESSSQNREYFAQQEFLWLNSENVPKEILNNRWEQLQVRIGSRDTYNQKKSILLDFIRYRKIAASIIILLGISTFLYFISRTKSPLISVQNTLDVPYGSKSILTLPDGTKLWVNSGTKISYNMNFGKSNRDINLVGEAYFDVAKNPKLPFVVHASNLRIKAIGTAFNVKAYPEEKRVETTLVHGLVEIEKIGLRDKILLKPNQKIVISNSIVNTNVQGKSIVSDTKEQNTQIVDGDSANIKLNNEIDTEKEISWKDGKLIFDRETLENLVVKLERRYDVHFTFADEKLKDYRYTGTFNDVSLEQIMDAMRLSSPINYIIKEKQVKILEKNH